MVLKMPAVDAEPPHDVVVDAIERPGDRSVGLGEREEGLPPQPAQNAALGEPHAVLDFRLIARLAWR